ncbi:MAG: hypothetical protein ACJAZ9_001701 [Neolewinella sp.]|jgi:hypothetical protein
MVFRSSAERRITGDSSMMVPEGIGSEVKTPRPPKEEGATYKWGRERIGRN